MLAPQRQNHVFKTTCLACALFTLPIAASAQTIWYVDDDCTPPGAGTEVDPFCTIQDGVDAAQDEDTVLVSPGTYTGDGNRDISLLGKAITLRSTMGPSATIIDVQGTPASIHNGFALNDWETRDTVIDGFTIKNGYLIGDTGGSGVEGGGGGAGIYLRRSSPTIRNCILADNVAAFGGNPFVHDGRGGGFYLDRQSSALIENCVMVNNVAGKQGGGILHIGDEGTGAEMHNCLVIRNTGSSGGGVHTALGSFALINTTIAYNNSIFGGGGLASSNSAVFVSNCILRGNDTGTVGPQVFASGPAAVRFEHNNVEGGLDDIAGCCGWQIVWGPGNIDADALFVDSDKGDF